jgi:hypothetical protein
VCETLRGLLADEPRNAEWFFFEEPPIGIAERCLCEKGFELDPH